MSETPDRYAVVGNPIGHSKSPMIHTMFAEQTGHNLEYTTMLVEPGQFAKAAGDFFASGGRGLNVTAPFKQDAWVFAKSLSSRGHFAAAVNTLIAQAGGHIRGDNTDGLGLVRDLTVNNGVELAGKRILLLGAGGAARGVLKPLQDQKPERIVIANRTESKAVELAILSGDSSRVTGLGYADLAGRQFDVIINSTSAGIQNEVPPLPDDCLASGGTVYDMTYKDEATAFVRWGREHGAAITLDGLGMLIEQAAESFLLWRGERPHTAPVFVAMRPNSVSFPF